MASPGLRAKIGDVPVVYRLSTAAGKFGNRLPISLACIRKIDGLSPHFGITAMQDSLEVTVRKTIRKHGMLSGGEHVLVAVSGGADSTALLLCLRRLAADFRLTLSVAHLNHRIRGAESDEDEEFVRQMACRLSLPFLSEAIDVKQQAKAAKRNLEETARQARYEFLGRAAQRTGATKIAVGHNLNDQAETILFRFIRGSGLQGLSAIRPVMGGTVIRPLLECSRRLILAYLERNQTGFREDSTNRDVAHTRNRIRRELIPFLEEHFNPRLAAALSREASLARETWDFIESEAEKAFQDIHLREGNNLSLKAKELLNAHPAIQKQVVRRALRECLGSLRGIALRHVESVLQLQSGARTRLPHGCLVLREFDSIILTKHPGEPSRPFAYPLEIPGTCRIPETGTRFVCTRGTMAPNPRQMKELAETQAFLEPSSLTESLTVRSRLPGDRYGGPGHRKVKRMLIDRRIPLSRRPFLPMIVAGTRVVWIPGFRPARGCEAQPGSPCVVISMRDASTGSAAVPAAAQQEHQSRKNS